MAILTVFTRQIFLMIEIKNEVVIHLLVSKAAKTYVNLFSKETAISFFMKL